jgi:hypothetical protein
VATAANTRTGELLLRFLTVTGWDVDVCESERGVTALAVQAGDGAPLRITAWAKTREAVSFALFEQVRTRMYADRPWAA